MHTSRAIRNSQRIGEALGVDIQLSSFQRSTILTVHDDESGEAITRVVKIPRCRSASSATRPQRPERDALDEHLPLAEIRRRYSCLSKNRASTRSSCWSPVGLANASFCRLFGGDWTAMAIVFTSTLVDSPPNSGCRPTASTTS